MAVSIAQNAIIGYPSWRSKITFTGGSWNATYPVTNLGVLPLVQVARSTDLLAASTQFIITFDHVRPVGLAAIVAHNLTTLATIRYRLWQDTARTQLLYDSGFISVFGISFPQGSVPWGSPYFWGGTYTVEDLAGYNITTPILFPQAYIAAAMTVEILDPSNSAGYIQVGLFDAAEPWQMSVNVAYGFQYGFNDRSITTEALGGAESVQKMPPQRVWQGEIDYLPHSEAMANPYELNRKALTADTFIWWLDPLDTANQIRNCVLARNAKVSNAARAVFSADSVPINIKEVIG